MHLNKRQITTYIKCPFMLAIETALAASKSTIHSPTLKAIIEKTKDRQEVQISDYLKRINEIRLHLSEIASYELKNNMKLSLSEYRIKFTNKFYSKATEVIEPKSVITNLNKLLDVFASNVFMGYNVPVDIPIQGTSLIFRDTVDFLLTDEEENVFAIEIEDLSDMDLVKKKLMYWVHYHIQYSFLAASFDKEVSVIIMDPVSFTKIDLKFKPERFNHDIKDMKMFVQPMQQNNLVKNLHVCPTCEFNKYCH